MKALEQGNYFANASKTYAQAALESASSAILDGIATTHLTHPTDTHPPLGDRLAALTMPIENVASVALDVQPEQPALQLLSNPERIEEDISAAFQAIVARNHHIALEAPDKSESAN